MVIGESERQALEIFDYQITRLQITDNSVPLW